MIFSCQLNVNAKFKKIAAIPWRSPWPRRIVISDFPELDGLSKSQLLFLIAYYYTHIEASYRPKWLDVLELLSLCFGFLIGCVFGCFLGVNVSIEWGGLIGGVAGVFVVTVGFEIVDYYFQKYVTLPKIRRFLQNDEGRLVIDQAQHMPAD